MTEKPKTTRPKFKPLIEWSIGDDFNIVRRPQVDAPTSFWCACPSTDYETTHEGVLHCLSCHRPKGIEA